MTTQAPSPPELSALVEILGRVDSLFLPPRADRWIRPTPAVLFEQQQDFANHGLAVRGAGDATTRKQTERQFMRLQSRGFVKLYRHRGSDRRLGVRLSDPCEDQLRQMCLDIRLSDCLPPMFRLARAFDEGLSLEWLFGLFWAPEFVLTDPPTPWNPTGEQTARLVDLEDRVLAGLSRGWLRASGDSHGRVWYGLNPSGRKILDNPPRFPRVRRKFSSKLADAYRVALNEETAAILKAIPRNPSNLGRIPLPCSLWADNPKLIAALRAAERPAP